MPCFIRILALFCLIFGAGMLVGIFLNSLGGWIGLAMVVFGVIALWN